MNKSSSSKDAPDLFWHVLAGGVVVYTLFVLLRSITGAAITLAVLAAILMFAARAAVFRELKTGGSLKSALLFEYFAAGVVALMIYLLIDPF